MKLKIVMTMFLVASLLSCKDDKKAVETENKAETEVQDPTMIQLSNLTDENWSGGVGVTYNMFLTDYTKEKEELLKNGKTLLLEDNTKVPYVGYVVDKQYIQIHLSEKGSTYKDIAAYPHEILVQPN